AELARERGVGSPARTRFERNLPRGHCLPGLRHLAELSPAAAAQHGTLPLMDTLPLLRAELLGQRSESSLIEGVAQLWGHDWIVLAGLSVVFVIVLPAVRMALLAMVLGALRLGRRPRWLGHAFRWAVWLDRWAMIDVLL